MAIGNSFSYIFGPIVALLGIGLMVLVLRWAYSRGSSVVSVTGKPGPADSYGLLVCVASPPNYAEGEMIRRTLEHHGINLFTSFWFSEVVYCLFDTVDYGTDL